MKRSFVAVLTLVATAALGQEFGRPDSSEIVEASTGAYGGAGLTAVTLPASVFEAVSNTHSWTTMGDGYKYSSSSLPFLSGVSLPSGATIEAIELRACDDSVTQDLSAYLWIFRDDGAGMSTPGVTTGVAAAPGCGVFSAAIDPPVEVKSGQQTIIPVVWAGTNSATRFSTMRVFYRRNVRPAPLAATFADVPISHGFFKFVEALAAAGITGGCGGGNYCPNNPVTRGQMAVFLASALGLHWPD